MLIQPGNPIKYNIYYYYFNPTSLIGLTNSHKWQLIKKSKLKVSIDNWKMQNKAKGKNLKQKVRLTMKTWKKNNCKMIAKWFKN